MCTCMCTRVAQTCSNEFFIMQQQQQLSPKRKEVRSTEVGRCRTTRRSECLCTNQQPHDFRPHGTSCVYYRQPAPHQCHHRRDCLDALSAHALRPVCRRPSEPCRLNRVRAATWSRSVTSQSTNFGTAAMPWTAMSRETTLEPWRQKGLTAAAPMPSAPPRGSRRHGSANRKKKKHTETWKLHR